MRNPDTSLQNENTLYIAMSGGGKSQALLQNPAIPKSGARVVMWDTNNDHRGRHYSKIGDFVRALDRANRENWRTGAGFRIGYDGPDTLEAYDIFCHAVMAILDGRKKTFVIVEELSAVCTHAGKARPAPAKMLNQCRKYGGVFHGTTQKPTEISKTYYSQCPVKFIGQQETAADIKKVCADCGLQPADVAALQQLQFIKKHGQESEKIELNYIRP